MHSSTRTVYVCLRLENLWEEGFQVGKIPDVVLPMCEFGIGVFGLQLVDYVRPPVL